MNKRTSKKKHIGPYQELGISVDFKWTEDSTEEARDAFMESFSDFLDSFNFRYGGGWGPKTGGQYICGTPIYVRHVLKWRRSKRTKSVTYEDRLKIVIWIEKNRGNLISNLRVSELIDSWNEGILEDLNEIKS